MREELEQAGEWSRERLTGFLSERLRGAGREQEADALILNEGTAQQRAFQLLEQGQVEQALDIARQNFSPYPGLVLRFADALAQAGADSAAATYLGERVAQGDPHVDYLSWLASHYEKAEGNLEAALQYGQHRFNRAADLKSYAALRRVATELGRWEQLRETLLEASEQRGQIELLIDIALEEGALDRALALMPRLTGGRAASYGEKVAQAAEEERPRAAIAVYCQLAETHIAGRQRLAYREAARLLARVRELYRRLGEEGNEAWAALIKELRTRHARLPALQDELNKAAL